jgi:hypothetical protein
MIRSCSGRLQPSKEEWWRPEGLRYGYGGVPMVARFEYKILTANHFRVMESQLNELGKEGWEVVSHTADGDYRYSVILKRAVG